MREQLKYRAYNDIISEQYVRQDFNHATIVSRVVKTKDGKSYLEVDGKPFLLAGVQIRLDQFYDMNQLKVSEAEKYFAAAKNLGVTCVQVPIQWKDIEDEREEFTFTKLDTILGFCTKYNLKMEVMWLGSIMCGESQSLVIPSYILDHRNTSTKVGSGHFHDMRGYSWLLDMGNNHLLERECKAVSMMLNHIGEWDRINGNRHPVISIQIENQPDSYPRWRGGDWTSFYRHLNAIGMVVKASNYRVVTRINVTSIHTVFDWVENIYSLEGIDMVGPDLFCFSPREIKDAIHAYARKLSGNFAHIAANIGSIPNCDTLMLAAFASGGGYSIYELAAMMYQGRYIEDYGILNRDLTDKPYTWRVRNLLICLKKLYIDVILTPAKKFAAFNISATNPKDTLVQTIKAGNVELTYRTENSGLAAAMVRDGYISAFSTTEGMMSFGNASLETIETGSYDTEGIWQREDVVCADRNILKMNACTAYRIQLKDTGPLILKSTTQGNIGNEASCKQIMHFKPISGEWTYKDGVYTTYLLYETSAMGWMGGIAADFCFEVELVPRMIVGNGLGIFFGAKGLTKESVYKANYIRICQDWQEAWIDMRIGVNVIHRHCLANGRTMKPQRLSVNVDNGKLTVFYDGYKVFDDSISLSEGNLGFMSWGCYYDYQDVSIVKK